MATNAEILKIKKLQALGKSPNPHEAQSAKSKAEILMKVHAVTQEMVDATDLDDGQLDHLTLQSKFRLSVEDKFLAPLLEKHFQVVILTRRQGLKREVFAVGKPEQLPRAKKAYVLLGKELKNGWKNYKNSYRDENFIVKTEKSRQSFYLGMFEALKKVLGDLEIDTQALTISVKDVAEQTGADEQNQKFEFPMDDLDAMKAGYYKGLRSEVLMVYLNK